MAASAWNSVTSTRTRLGSRATAVLVTFRPPPTAAAVTERVRRSEARARVVSASGQSSTASRSRLNSRPSTASSASTAVAFLVSKLTGVPFRVTTGGPSRAKRGSAAACATARSCPPWSALGDLVRPSSLTVTHNVKFLRRGGHAVTISYRQLHMVALCLVRQRGDAERDMAQQLGRATAGGNGAAADAVPDAANGHRGWRRRRTGSPAPLRPHAAPP